MSIRFEHVSKAFGKKVILNDISFEVEKGEILFILGKSGMGKSVTLKHIIGILKPDSGRVFVEKQEVSAATEKELPSIRRKCGMVFQHPALLDSMSVLSNIAFGLKTPQYLESLGRLNQPLTEAEILKIVREKLKLVQLAESVLPKMPSEISYGMQKRVSLARTLAPGPDYLLFDEPTTGLDPIVTTAINDLISELSRALQVTSVVVSHDMRCALSIADRILMLDQGRILECGTVEQIKKSKQPLIRDFLSEALEMEATS